LTRPHSIRWPNQLLTLTLLVCIGAGTPGWAQFETRSTRSFPGELFGLAAGDFSHNGTLDVATTNGNALLVALGKGDGTFQPATTYSYPVQESLAAGDFNGDSNLDLVAVPETPSGVSVFLGNGDGTFQAPITSTTTAFVRFIAVGDFNGDGRLDLVVIDPPYISVLLGNGDGTFQAPIDNDSFIAPGNLAVGDFNNDHNLDVMVVGSYGSTSNVGVLLGNGDGILQSSLTYPLLYTANSVAVGDFNRDGDLDAAIEGKGPVVTVLLGDGEGGFGKPEYYDVATDYGQIAAADLNGDGALDLAMAGFSGATSSGLSILNGRGDGTFQAARFYPAGITVESLAVGDFNGDHKPDVVLLDRDHGAITLLNTGVASFSPTTPLVFKKQNVGTTSAPQTVTLTNTGKTALKISAMKASSQFGVTSNCGKGITARAKCTVSITFSPTSQGAKSGTVTINDSASSKPQVIELSGTGT
jgi:hypothetical protein